MQFINIPSGQLAVVDQGTGPVLLLVHGFPLDHTLWQNQIEALSSSHRVIAPDLRGFGRSASAGTEALTMTQHADDLRHLLDALAIHEPVHFCGLSMGGYVAFEFWRRHASRLRSLILCDTKAAADTPEAAANREKMALDVLREGVAVTEKAMLPKLLASDTPQRQPHVVEHTRRMILGTSPETIAAAQRGMAQRADMRPLLGEIRLPTLVMVGEMDVISPPEEMQAIADAIPSSKIVVIPAAGHLTPMEAAAEFNEALTEFLTLG